MYDCTEYAYENDFQNELMEIVGKLYKANIYTTNNIGNQASKRIRDSRAGSVRFYIRWYTE